MIKEEDLLTLINIAHLARKYEFFPLSERMFQHFSAAFPLRGFPHIGLALIHFQLGHYSRSCVELEKAMELGEKSKDAYFIYGMCLFHCGKYEKSADALSCAMEMDKKDGGGGIIESSLAVLKRPEVLPFFKQHPMYL